MVLVPSRRWSLQKCLRPQWVTVSTICYIVNNILTRRSRTGSIDLCPARVSYHLMFHGLDAFLARSFTYFSCVSFPFPSSTFSSLTNDHIQITTNALLIPHPLPSYKKTQTILNATLNTPHMIPFSRQDG